MKPEIWNLLDQLRGVTPLHDLVEIVKKAKAQGIYIDFNDIRAINSRDTGIFTTPEIITEFIISLSKNYHFSSVLDCCAKIGDILSPIAQKYRPKTAIGLNNVLSEIELAKLLQPDFPISWQQGDPLNLLEHMNSRFDLIVGSPPWGVRHEPITLNINNQEFEFNDDFASLLVLKASLLLNESGKGLFLLPQKFISDRKPKKVILKLNELGLWIEAAFYIPKGIFSTISSLGGVLVVVSRQPFTSTFIGEISIDKSQCDVLINNYLARKEAKTPQMGTIVNIDQFSSLPKLIAQQEIFSLARSSGLLSIPLIDICSGSNLPKSSIESGFLDFPNSVYLPLLGNSDVVASLTELKIKPQNYIQLIIDPEKAVAAYVAQFFNSNLGKKIMAYIRSENYIPKLTKNSISNAVIYLPSIDEQIEVIHTQSSIVDISSKLETMSRELWSFPKKHKDIQKQIKSMQPKNSFEEWLETLPFPISSVLWAFQADAVIEHKVSHLFLFFEALSEFLSVIMLSAYASDKDFYILEQKAWTDNDPKYKDWILAASFGSWIILGERLAKFTRKILDDKEKRERCINLFGNPSTEFLSMITDKGIFFVLKQANYYRDQWKGHSGALSEKDHAQHLELLQAELSKIRNIMQDKWNSAIFISPMGSEYSEGLFDYQVKVLLGTRTPFKQVSVKTLIPMDKSKLYVLHSGQMHPVELLSLIRLMESPKTQANAFYFYNRMDGNQVRWVSYHFELESEIFRADTAIAPILKLLSPNTIP